MCNTATIAIWVKAKQIFPMNNINFLICNTYEYNVPFGKVIPGAFFAHAYNIIDLPVQWVSIRHFLYETLKM